jgi:hypothetical protein
MAIDYFLVLHERHDAEALRSFLLGHGMQTIDGKFMFASHVAAWVAAHEEPNPRVIFRLRKSSEPDDYDRELFGFVAALLQHFPGDATLSFELDTTVLARRGERLQRGRSDDVWTDESWLLAQAAFGAHGMTFDDGVIDVEPRLWNSP